MIFLRHFNMKSFKSHENNLKIASPKREFKKTVNQSSEGNLQEFIFDDIIQEKTDDEILNRLDVELGNVQKSPSSSPLSTEDNLSQEQENEMIGIIHKDLKELFFQQEKRKALEQEQSVPPEKCVTTDAGVSGSPSKNSADCEAITLTDSSCCNPHIRLNSKETSSEFIVSSCSDSTQQQKLSDESYDSFAFTLKRLSDRNLNVTHMERVLDWEVESNVSEVEDYADIPNTFDKTTVELTREVCQRRMEQACRRIESEEMEGSIMEKSTSSIILLSIDTNTRRISYGDTSSKTPTFTKLEDNSEPNIVECPTIDSGLSKDIEMKAAPRQYRGKKVLQEIKKCSAHSKQDEGPKKEFCKYLGLETKLSLNHTTLANVTSPRRSARTKNMQRKASKDTMPTDIPKDNHIYTHFVDNTSSVSKCKSCSEDNIPVESMPESDTQSDSIELEQSTTVNDSPSLLVNATSTHDLRLSRQSMASYVSRPKYEMGSQAKILLKCAYEKKSNSQLTNAESNEKTQSHSCIETLSPGMIKFTYKEKSTPNKAMEISKSENDAGKSADSEAENQSRSRYNESISSFARRSYLEHKYKMGQILSSLPTPRIREPLTNSQTAGLLRQDYNKNVPKETTLNENSITERIDEMPTPKIKEENSMMEVQEKRKTRSQTQAENTENVPTEVEDLPENEKHVTPEKKETDALKIMTDQPNFRIAKLKIRKLKTVETDLNTGTLLIKEEPEEPTLSRANLQPKGSYESDHEQYDVMQTKSPERKDKEPQSCLKEKFRTEKIKAVKSEIVQYKNKLKYKKRLGEITVARTKLDGGLLKFRRPSARNRNIFCDLKLLKIINRGLKFSELSRRQTKSLDMSENESSKCILSPAHKVKMEKEENASRSIGSVETMIIDGQIAANNGEDEGLNYCGTTGLESENHFENEDQDVKPSSFENHISHAPSTSCTNIIVIPNPLQHHNGIVLHAYYNLDILTVVQEHCVSFWKYMKLIQIFGKPQNWEFFGSVPRKNEDNEILSPYKNRICTNETFPLYIEMRARQFPEDPLRECNLATVYINIYFYDEKKSSAIFRSVQLDTVRGLASDIVFTTITGSRYFVMCWKEQTSINSTKTGICKYSLTPDLDTLASIREFKYMRHIVQQVECLDGEKLIGFGDSQVTIWNHQTGDVLTNIDLEMSIGINLGSILRFSEGKQYLILYQNRFNNSIDMPELKIFAVNLGQSPYSFRLVHTHVLPPSFVTITSSFGTDEFLLATTSNGDELILFPQQPHRLVFSHQSSNTHNTKTFQSTGSTHFIEISDDNLHVKTIHEYLIDFVK